MLGSLTLLVAAVPGSTGCSGAPTGTDTTASSPTTSATDAPDPQNPIPDPAVGARAEEEIGGLVSSTGLTLILVPVLYLVFDRFRRRPVEPALD